MILRSFLGLEIFLLNKPHLFIHLIESSTDLDFRSLSDSRFDDTHQQGLEDVEQSLILGFLEDNFHIVDLDFDSVDFEDAIAILGLSRSESNIERQSVTTDENVHDTSISEGWESLFLVDPVRDILQIALNLRAVEGEMVHAAIGDSLASHAEEVVDLQFGDVREQVFGLEDKVFDDSINFAIANFDSRDLNVRSVNIERHTGT